MPLKVLISLIDFSALTGAPMYCYELARELTRRGHAVTIIAPKVGGDLYVWSRRNGVEVYSFDDAPDEDFDILHLNEFEPARFALGRYNAPAVATVHSEYPCEEPLYDPRIKAYICIRESVALKLVKGGMDSKRIRVIPNGIDLTRFRPAPLPNKKSVLFAGTIDPLRKKSAFNMMDCAGAEYFKVIFVGKKYDSWADDLPDYAEWYDQAWWIEEYVKRCTHTAGVLLGRSTIEGWAMGRPGYIYDIDLEGNIKDMALHHPPADMSKYDIVNVTDEIAEIYERFQ